MQTTSLNGQTVIITEGATTQNGKVAGIFRTAEDARSEDADRLALGTVAWDSLTPEQRQIATANSESL